MLWDTSVDLLCWGDKLSRFARKGKNIHFFPFLLWLIFKLNGISSTSKILLLELFFGIDCILKIFLAVRDRRFVIAPYSSRGPRALQALFRPLGQKASGGFKNTSELDEPLVLSANKFILLQFSHLIPCAVCGWHNDRCSLKVRTFFQTNEDKLELLLGTRSGFGSCWPKGVILRAVTCPIAHSLSTDCVRSLLYMSHGKVHHIFTALKDPAAALTINVLAPYI